MLFRCIGRAEAKRFGDFGDFTFIFVGNFELATIESLVRRYLGSLPSAGRQESTTELRTDLAELKRAVQDMVPEFQLPPATPRRPER